MNDINDLLKKYQKEYSENFDKMIYQGIKKKGIDFKDISELNGRIGRKIQGNKNVLSIDNIDFLEEIRGGIKNEGGNVSMEYDYRFL